MRCLILLFALVTAASAQQQLLRVQTDVKTDSYVEVTALFTRPAPSGYLPIRVSIANRMTIARSVDLSFESSNDYGSDGSKTKSSFSFDAPAEKSSQHDILVPLSTLIAGSRSGEAQVQLTLGGSMGSGIGNVSGEYAMDQPAVLLGEKLFTPNGSALDADLAAKFSSYRGGSNQFAAKFDARQMPEDWRAYAGYDSLILTDAEWTAASASARGAVLAWVRLGGQLLIYSESGGATGLNLPTDSSFGEISVKPIAPGLKLNASQTVNATVSRKSTIQQKSIREDYSSRWPLQSSFGVQGFNYAVFILILIAFGVVVGPVNLFVFAKSGRRHRLFITTPLISLATSLLLVGLILLMDGFGGRGVRLILMEVRPDNGENAAYLHQEQFSRTGVLTGAGFTLNEAATLSPVPIDADNRWARLTLRNGGSGTGYSSEFIDGKLKTSGDWFQSRSEQGHVLSAVIPTRGRIERATPGGSPQLLSTFDFQIETLCYKDNANQWWKAENIVAGSRFQPIQISEADAEQILSGERNRFGERNRKLLNNLQKRPGCFVAITTAATGIDTFKGIKWKETRTILTGPIVQP